MQPGAMPATPAAPATQGPQVPSGAAAPNTSDPTCTTPTGCDTTTTFTVSTGALTISVPATASLSNAAPGTSATGALGTVTVSDLRANLVAAWTATAASSDFTTGAAAPAETIPATDVSYWSGAATATTGTGTFTPGQAAVGDAVAIDTAQTAFALTDGVGNNTAAWNPHVIVAVPAQAVAGLYTGTITHSVA